MRYATFNVAQRDTTESGSPRGSTIPGLPFEERNPTTASALDPLHPTVCSGVGVCLGAIGAPPPTPLRPSEPVKAGEPHWPSPQPRSWGRLGGPGGARAHY